MIRHIACVSLLLTGLLSGSTAGAQAEPKNFPVERLKLAIDREGLIGVEAAGLADPWTWNVSLLLDYEHDPLTLYRLSDGHRIGTLVRNRFDGSLGGAFVFLKWLEVGVDVPVSFYQDRDVHQPNVAYDNLSKLQAFGFGDVRVAPKFQLLRAEKFWLDLAVLTAVTFPSGLSRNYLGENSVTFQPNIALSKMFREGWRVAVNLGATVRKPAQVLNQIVESEGSYGLGLGYRFRRPWEIDTTLDGSFSLIRPFRHSNQDSLEWRAQVGYQAWKYAFPFVGAGLGILHGWGQPDWRVFIGVRFGPGPKPPAEPLPPEPEPEIWVDAAPVPVTMLAENFDGPAPEPDTDGDGIIDRLDHCPNEPGPESNYGCKIRVVLVPGKKLDIMESVYFETGKDIIKPESFALLDNVAQVINDHAEIVLVRVEGHTDSTGGAANNLKLSDRRAKSVVRYLIEHGVAAVRLTPRGYGQTRPIASNKTPAGKAKNRRVEFVIEK